MKPTVVVPCFRRPRALARLLRTIAGAVHPAGTNLVISVEGDPHPAVVQIAQEFQAPNVNPEVILRDRRMGLREHLLACGDLAIERGAVIILEDDLVVDRYYYQFALDGLRNYHQSDAIAGIALYAPEYNEYAGLPFRPVHNGHDTYLMQVPCSWGQAWSHRQWKEFRSWYDSLDNSSVVDAMRALPDQVKRWPPASWKRYFAAYLVDTNKSFVYPYDSFTSNCGDAGGTHMRQGTHTLQVAMGDQSRLMRQFDFCPVDRPRVSYDAYMEASGHHVMELVGLGRSEVSIDLYGLKPVDEIQNRPFVLTRKAVSSAIAEYPLSFRPIEQNIGYPAQAGRGALFLTRSTDVQGKRRIRATLEFESYYAGFPLATRGHLAAVVEEFPRLLRSWVARRLRGAQGGRTRPAASDADRPSSGPQP